LLVEVKIFVLILASAGLALLTRHSLQRFRSHGLYRFFAFVAVSVLVLLNLEHWFNEPFTLRQIVSWLLLLVSIVMSTYGVISLRRGRLESGRKDATLLGIEKTTELVTTGAYRFIRHPLYSSLLFGALGIMLKHVSWQSTLITGIIVFFTIMTARMEETENIQYFGDDYCSYMKRTKMFIPFLL
jgi:protein-S-isoprenylcysteine O-methyltransferase Ste14